jgi:hypothetical protein
MEWKPIPGLPGYEASSQGRIRKNVYIDRRGNCRKAKELTLTQHPEGYLSVYVREQRRNVLVHRLVAAAFKGEPDARLQVNHLNGNKTDNRPANLEWVTPSANMRHAVRVLGRNIGNRPGEGNNAAKLTARKVKAIRRVYEPGKITLKQLADQFQVSVPCIWHIVKGHTWRHV